MMRLCDIPPGGQAVIREVHIQGAMRRRLLELGLTVGTTVECLGRSAWGDPTAYLVRGTVLALRARDCAGILTEPEVDP